jgi:NADH-quinone oxidoreductase subunit H
MSTAVNALLSNPLMQYAVDPLREALLSLGTLGMLAWIVLKILAIAVPVIVSVAFYVVWERKLIGWMHVRHGPMYVGWGILQAFADVFKLLFKEVVQPSVAQPVLYRLAPLLVLVPAFAAWAVVPFDAQVVLSNANAGLLYLLAMTSLGIYGVIIAGWASNSKYAFLGAMRASAQMISYEIAMGFSLVGVLIAAGSLNLSDIVVAQGGKGFLGWFFIPLAPLFVVYFVSGVAETNRAPFDVVEGESEIVAGHMVEYSGSQFALFFLAEYANMLLVSFLTSIFFLGGWLSPIQGLVDLGDVHWLVNWIWQGGWPWLLAKVFFFATCFIWFRAAFPRYRYDQIMRLGWKVFIPITIAWIFVTAMLVYFGVIGGNAMGAAA